MLRVRAGEPLWGRDHWWLSRWQCDWGDRTAQTLLYWLSHPPDHLQPPLWDGIKWGKKISTDSQVLQITSSKIWLSTHRERPPSPSASWCIPYASESRWQNTPLAHPLLTCSQSLCTTSTSHLLPLGLWSALLWFSSVFLPPLLSSSPPYVYGNQLNIPWQGRRGRNFRNQQRFEVSVCLCSIKNTCIQWPLY